MAVRLSLRDVRNKLMAIARGEVVGKPTILVLDDQVEFTQLLCEALKQENLWEVYGAFSIKQVWEMKIRFDYMIVDILLCGDRGDMFVKEYCRRYPGAKTLLITAYPKLMESVEEEGYHSDSLIKPFSIDEVVSKVKKSLLVEQVLDNSARASCMSLETAATV
jgi:DNA-binding NtrC family response regulator